MCWSCAMKLLNSFIAGIQTSSFAAQKLQTYCSGLDVARHPAIDAVTIDWSHIMVTHRTWKCKKHQSNGPVQQWQTQHRKRRFVVAHRTARVSRHPATHQLPSNRNTTICQGALSFAKIVSHATGPTEQRSLRQHEALWSNRCDTPGLSGER